MTDLIYATEAATAKAAQDAALSARPGDIFLLEGDLGAGKSFFARNFIRQMMNDPEAEVPSPTFTLVQTYDSAKGTIWHFDLYRLKDPEEIFDLGWEEALAGGILLVEWPDRLGPYRPVTAVTLNFTIIENAARRVVVEDRRSA